MTETSMPATYHQYPQTINLWILRFENNDESEKLYGESKDRFDDHDARSTRGDLKGIFSCEHIGTNL